MDCSYRKVVLMLTGNIICLVTAFWHPPPKKRRNLIVNVFNYSLMFPFSYLLREFLSQTLSFSMFLLSVHPSPPVVRNTSCYGIPFTNQLRILGIISITKHGAKISMALTAGRIFCEWFKNPICTTLYMVSGVAVHYDGNRTDVNVLDMIHRKIAGHPCPYRSGLGWIAFTCTFPA